MVRTTETKCPLCGTPWEVEFGVPFTKIEDLMADRPQRIPLVLRCPGCGLRPIPDAEDRVVRGDMPTEWDTDESAQQMAVDVLVKAALEDLAEDAAAPIERKCRVYQFSVQSALQHLMTGFDLSNIVIAKGFTSDAQYVRGWVDESTQVVNLVVHSKAFPVVDDGECMPVASMEFEHHEADEADRQACCGSIGYSDGKFTCSNGATAVWHDEELTVTLPGCKPFTVLTEYGAEIALFGMASACVAMRAVNVVSPEVACSILDVPGGYAAVKLGE